VCLKKEKKKKEERLFIRAFVFVLRPIFLEVTLIRNQLHHLKTQQWKICLAY